MKAILVGVLTVLISGLGGCKTMQTGNAFSEYDDFDKTGEIGIVIGGLGSSFSDFQATGSSFARLEKNGSLVSHVFQATVMHRDFPVTVTSAAFEVDGETFTLTAHETSSTYSFSRFRVLLSESQIARLAKAESIRFRAYSSRGKFPAWEFSRSQRDATRKYYEQYVLSRPAE